MVKLNLGCGRAIIPGFINADIAPGPGVDLVVDLNNLAALRSWEWYGHVGFVYLSHVLEHFPTAQVPILLKSIHDVLDNGGRVRVAVPDLDRICKLYVNQMDWFKPPHNPWLGLIYGGQIDQYDFHKTGFNFAYLEWLLCQAGFTAIVEVGGSDDLGVFDGSQSNLPFGNISLNVEGAKGSGKASLHRFHYTPFESILARVADGLMRLLQATTRLRIGLIRRRIRRSTARQGA